MANVVRDCMFQNVATLNPDATLMEVARKMVRQKPGFAVVLDQMRLIGLTTEFDLVRWMVKGHDMEARRIDQMPLSVPMTVQEETPLQELLTLFNQRRFRRFPVLNADHMLSGGIMEKQILANLPRSQLLSHYRVLDVTGLQMPLVGPELTYMQVAERMVRWHRGCVLVNAGERLLGIITEGDLLRERIKDGWSPQMHAGEFMRTETITIEPHRDLLFALQFLIDTGHRRLPVVDGDGRLRGLLTQTDILKRMTHAVRSHGAILNPEDIPDPAVWVEPTGEHRIQAVNEKGALALGLDPGGWVGRSAHDLVADPDLWPAIAVILQNSGSLGPINLGMRNGRGEKVCVSCRFTLIHTPAGEDRIFWTIGELDSERTHCTT